MEKQSKSESVPYIVFEGEMVSQERHIRRLIIALIIATCLIFACNAIWLWAWCQYDYTSEETIYTQDGQGVNIIGDENRVANQTSPPQNENAKRQQGHAAQEITP